MHYTKLPLTLIFLKLLVQLNKLNIDIQSNIFNQISKKKYLFYFHNNVL